MSGPRLFAYESVHNKSLGKMEMLEAIDDYIKNSISKDISFLKSEIKKLKSKKNKNTTQRYNSSKSYANQGLDKSAENSTEIRRIRRDLDRLVVRINSLSTSVDNISKSVQNLITEENINRER